jgi:hypothetical protein
MHLMKAAFLFCALAVAFFAAAVYAQQPVLKLTAASANVSEPGKNVRIDLNRWSSDQERQQLLAAMTPPPPEPPAAETEAPAPVAEAGRGARGGARGGQTRGGTRGGLTRGGGRGRGGTGAAAPADPIASLTATIGKAQTLGYIWTNEVTGYAIKYALKLPLPGGGERIVLATDRRIGAHALAWQPASGNPTTYEFTLLEIRLNSTGSGEGKASLTAAVAIDNENKTIGLENYAAAPALLESVKRR